MGQTTSSCVSGTMGWQEPYMPAKIITDLVVDEYQLNNAVPMEQQNINRRLTSLLALKCGCLDSTDASGHSSFCQKTCEEAKRNFITKSDSFQYSRDYNWKKSLHKESYCKDVNFNCNQNENLKESSENIKLIPLVSADELPSTSSQSRNGSPAQKSQSNDLSEKGVSSQVNIFPLPAYNRCRRITGTPSGKMENLNATLMRDISKTENSLLYERTSVSELQDTYCQTKPINQTNQSSDETVRSSSAVENCKEVLVLLTNHADNIATHFAAAIKAANRENWKSVHEITRNIYTTIRVLVQDCSMKGNLKHYASLSWQRVIISSDELMTMLNRNTTSKDNLKTQLTTLGQDLHNVMESLVLYELLIIVEEIIENNNVSQAINALIDLSKISDFMCCLIVKAGGIQAMTNLLLLNQPNSVYTATLRALMILCNVQPALCHLKKHGIEHILQMLHSKYGNEVLREAVGLIAQLTEKRDTPVTSQILENCENIILLMKDIISKTEDEVLFLLTTAAITNLSVMSSVARRSIVKHSILKILVSACMEKTIAQSPAVKEQIATVLATFADYNDETDVVDESIINLLLSFIKLQSSSQYSHRERTMYRRTQEKSAALLSVLCNQKRTINMLVNDKGLYQLLSICQNKEFNNSRALLFCTLVLQQVANSCQDRHNLCKESVKFSKSPTDQSFYFSQQESFV